MEIAACGPRLRSLREAVVAQDVATAKERWQRLWRKHVEVELQDIAGQVHMEFGQRVRLKIQVWVISWPLFWERRSARSWGSPSAGSWRRSRCRRRRWGLRTESGCLRGDVEVDPRSATATAVHEAVAQSQGSCLHLVRLRACAGAPRGLLALVGEVRCAKMAGGRGLSPLGDST